MEDEHVESSQLGKEQVLCGIVQVVTIEDAECGAPLVTQQVLDLVVQKMRFRQGSVPEVLPKDVPLVPAEVGLLCAVPVIRDFDDHVFDPH